MKPFDGVGKDLALETPDPIRRVHPSSLILSLHLPERCATITSTASGSTTDSTLSTSSVPVLSFLKRLCRY